MTTKTKIRVDLALDDDTLAQYEGRAAAVGIELEGLLSRHLTSTKDHVGEGGVFLTGPEAAEIRRLLGSKVGTGEKIVEMIGRLVKANIGGLKVELTPNQIESLRWSAKSAGKPVEEIAKMIVTRAIARELKTR